MNYQQLDKIADGCNPLFILLIIGLAIGTLKKSAWPFLLSSGLAVVVVQQLSKYAQKKEMWGDNFPSTHFAVALALCVSLLVLRRRFWPLALLYVVGYGALIGFQNYHTPAEMLGSFFAVPIALLFHLPSRKTRAIAH